MLVVVLIVSCAGIASAANLNNSKVISIGEETSKTVQKVQKNPKEVANEIIANYFTVVMKKGNSEGVPLDSFRIVNVDNSNPNDINVSVILKYQDLDEWPAIDYSVVRINDRYQVQKQVCVLDIAPFNEGHALILPKKHYWDVEEMDKETAHAVMDASKKVSKVLKELYNPDGISVCQNGGVFNDLSHYHMHIIPRYKGDGFSWAEPLFPHGAENHLGETKSKIVKALKA